MGEKNPTAAIERYYQDMSKGIVRLQADIKRKLGYIQEAVASQVRTEDPNCYELRTAAQHIREVQDLSLQLKTMQEAVTLLRVTVDFS